uniref:Uncharacterized protein n=1 Tax=Hyaloperonospora arabidopsidis (strain Emoy2) TaxID=559515 RepID=M4BSR8_HYAAE
MAYHHTCVEVVLIADIPAQAQLCKSLPRQSPMRELVDANSRTDHLTAHMIEFVQDGHRIFFNGQHPLILTFTPRLSAGRWADKQLKL